MSRPKSENLTPLELEIMHVLWAEGPANVQSVQQHLERELAYTTVQTMLNILQKKGKVKRKLVGKAYEYRPVLSRERALREAAGDLIERVFGGSVDALLMSLVKSRQLDKATLAKMEKLIEMHEKAEDEHGSD